VFGSLTWPIHPWSTAGDLLADLAEVGADLLARSIEAAAAGTEPVPQPETGISLAPKITPGDVRLDWTEPAARLERLIRAANPEPAAWTTLAGERLQIMAAEVADEWAEPGELVVRKREVLAGTGSAALRLVQVVPAGKKAMAGADWARGLRLAGPAFLGRDA
jgi:methionyl-tRNA formyltransferase